MNLEPGNSLSHYVLIEKIGEGGMGEVWRAEDTTLKRDVAIKILHDQLANDPKRQKRFEREARALAALQHPNVASIYGFEQSDGLAFLAMELVEGEDLAAHIKRCPLNNRETLDIAKQIVDGLEAAHERGIVHRDLKPGNVGLADDGAGQLRAKILDFGLALDTDGGDPLSQNPDETPTRTVRATEAGTLLGTAAYMSPEQATGKLVDARTDIWAFGVVLYEMLTGEMLFARGSIAETLSAVLNHDPDLTRLPRELDSTLNPLIKRCLQRKLRDRLRHIADARIFLEGGVGAAESRAVPVQSRIGRIGWFALTAALVATTALLSMLWRPGATPREHRVLDLVGNGFDRSWSLAPTLSPDGSRIAYLSRQGLWVRELDRLSPRLLVEIEDPQEIFWSPDSRQIGYIDANYLWRIEVDAPTAVRVCALPGNGRAVGGDWREDDLIIFAAWRGGLYTVPASGGTPELILPHKQGEIVDFHFPQWLPDGSALIFIHYHRDFEPSSGGSGTGASAPKDRPSAVAVLTDGELEYLAFPLSGKGAWVRYDPESAMLVYSTEDTNAGIYAVEFDLKARTIVGESELVFPDGFSISLADNGSMLYTEGIESLSGSELVRVDMQGQLESVVLRSDRRLAELALSPDGKWVALIDLKNEVNSDLAIVELETGNVLPLTFTDVEELNPSWSPRGDRIVYAEAVDVIADLVTLRTDGTGGRRVLASDIGIGANHALAFFSADGKQIFYSVDTEGVSTLMLGDLGSDGGITNIHRFFSEPSARNVIDVQLSPDGTMLAYTAVESGRAEIYLTTFPEGAGRWAVSRDGGKAPQWSAESDVLFFVSGRGPNKQNLCSATVTVGDGVRVGAPRVLFNPDEMELDGIARGDYAIAPDRDGLIVVRSIKDRNAPSRMIFVEAWAAALGDRR